MIKKIILTFLVVLFICKYSMVQEATVGGIVEMRGFKPLLIGLENAFMMEQNAETQSASQEIYTILKNDLTFSRLFKIIESKDYPNLPSYQGKDVDLTEWKKMQVASLINLKVLVKENEMTFEGRLLDVRTGDLIKGKRYSWDKKFLRQTVHRFANEILLITWGVKVPLFTSKICYTSTRDGNKEIYMMDYDGFDQKRLTNNTVLDLFPNLNPDGKNIAFSTFRGNKAVLLVYNMYTGQSKVISDAGGLNSLPAWSIDGKKLAFISSKDGNSEIYMINSDGTDLKRITFGNYIDASPAWSPTGRQIAFTSDRSGRPNVYIMDAEGTNVRRLTFYGEYNESPSFSPDGTHLAFVQRGGIIFDIYVLNLQTQEIIRLTQDQGSNESPKWSPDGLHIVFASNRTGTFQIYVMDSDGTNPRQITNQGNNTTPTWTAVP
jgi:TolB protein